MPSLDLLDAPGLQSIDREPPRTRWETFFLAAVGVLSSTIVLKIAQIQYLEILYIVQIGVIVATFLRNRGRAVVFRPLVRIAVMFLLFLIAALSLAVAALRYDFYLPTGLSPLMHPVIIAVSRGTELSASVIIMLYLANRFRKFPGRARFTMRVYFWTGVASAVYSLLSYPIQLAGFGEYGSYLVTHRLRGFYNEGGPYGLYLISLFVVGIALYRLHWDDRNRIRLVFLPLALVLVMAQSKSAVMAVLLLLLLNGIFGSGVTQRFVILGSAGIFLFVASQVVDVAGALRGYARSNQRYEQISRHHNGDPNFVNGRVAGAFILPRMVAAHPLAGIGWGNYSLVRNSPEYRGASVFTDSADDPGIGIFGLTADLGLPLFFYLLLCVFTPCFLLARRRAPAFLINLAFLQPLVHLFGAQLNITYPWVVTAFALGLGFAILPPRKLQPHGLVLEVS